MGKIRTISPTNIADWFLFHVDRCSGSSMTHLKLQKLVYYAQAWSLANFNRTLFDEDVQAWTHGPVSPSVWQQHRESGWSELPPPEAAPALQRPQDAILPMVLAEYGKYDAKFLEDMTHMEAPWKRTRGDLPLEARCTKPIPKILMRDFYAKKIKKVWPKSIATD